ncbi:ribosome-associated translation inhibitor RaiA [Candidatus Wolfebacteria bacterium]|nr:ribosome-associated translation inhibitor RaiA [Candidatus Wolfebacteria bacterium]
MNINIKATKLDLTPAIKEYVEIKIGSIDKFLKKFEIKSEIEVFVEIARTTKHHHKGDIFYAEANLRVGKILLRAEDTDWDIRVAIDKVKNRLEQEIKKYKEKKIADRRN